MYTSIWVKKIFDQVWRLVCILLFESEEKFWPSLKTSILLCKSEETMYKSEENFESTRKYLND